MLIRAENFEHNFNTGLPTVLAISSEKNFVTNAGEIYLAGEIVRVSCSFAGNKLVIPAILGIPATNETDVANLRYQVRLFQIKGTREIALPFLFDDVGVRLPQTVTGEISWNEIRQSNHDYYPCQSHQPGLLLEQALQMFFPKSSLDEVIEQLLTGGGNFAPLVAGKVPAQYLPETVTQITPIIVGGGTFELISNN